ncbi:hypothetical protein CWU58_23430 [Salmonella enterica]|uniref:Fimbrial protein n=1 Tax=Salmonella enterica TaxID=28901 RepID=A0A744FCN9_SALER|nr:hypothetical protein [Salmonella enterica]HAF2529858.1 hypothetical protein [Salmonella enterica]
MTENEGGDAQTGVIYTITVNAGTAEIFKLGALTASGADASDYCALITDPSSTTNFKHCTNKAIKLDEMSSSFNVNLDHEQAGPIGYGGKTFTVPLTSCPE